jgi:hypothetical protein
MPTVSLPELPATILAFPPAAATDIDTYTLDLSSWSGTDVVNGGAVGISPSGTGAVVLIAITTTSSGMSARLAGGTAGTDYTITYYATTAAGRARTADVHLFITSAGASAEPPVGSPLTYVPYPTSPVGLAVGAIWQDGDFLRVVTAGES